MLVKATFTGEKDFFFLAEDWPEYDQTLDMWLPFKVSLTCDEFNRMCKAFHRWYVERECDRVKHDITCGEEGVLYGYVRDIYDKMMEAAGRQLPRYYNDGVNIDVYQFNFHSPHDVGYFSHHREEEWYDIPEGDFDLTEDGRRLRTCSIFAEGDVIVPESVSCIDNHAFCDCSRITSLTVPDSVTDCDELSLGECWSLRRVRLPECLKRIGVADFQDCINLQKIEVPEGVQTIGRFAFGCCLALRSVTFRGASFTVDEGAFSNCRSLKEIHFMCNDLMKVRKTYRLPVEGCTLFVPKGRSDFFRSHPFFGRYKEIREE